MLRIQQHLDFVKRQLEYQTRQRDRSYSKLEAKAAAGADINPDKHKALLHERIVAELTSLLDSMVHDIEHGGGGFGAEGGPRGRDELLGDLLDSPTSLTPAHLRDLPQELVDQLQISESDKFQWDVIDLINRSYGQTMSIEVLLIALYRLTGKVFERTDLSNRLYRITRKGGIFTVQGRKGFYTTRAGASGQLDFQEEHDPDAVPR